MAISFETVTGNQTSANVLAQINNNFAKINSTPVPKADFATNADTVDNKHASELIPGAATFLNSVSTLANLSVGRYFCTQTRQSWEPVVTTGNRTFLIEVSLDTPNSLKSYKITYIAGVGAGESYYSDYSSGSIRWNRTVTDKNIENLVSAYNYLIFNNRKMQPVLAQDGFYSDKNSKTANFITQDGTKYFVILISAPENGISTITVQMYNMDTDALLATQTVTQSAVSTTPTIINSFCDNNTFLFYTYYSYGTGSSQPYYYVFSFTENSLTMKAQIASLSYGALLFQANFGTGDYDERKSNNNYILQAHRSGYFNNTSWYTPGYVFYNKLTKEFSERKTLGSYPVSINDTTNVSMYPGVTDYFVDKQKNIFCVIGEENNDSGQTGSKYYRVGGSICNIESSTKTRLDFTSINSHLDIPYYNSTSGTSYGGVVIVGDFVYLSANLRYRVDSSTTQDAASGIFKFNASTGVYVGRITYSNAGNLKLLYKNSNTILCYSNSDIFEIDVNSFTIKNNYGDIYTTYILNPAKTSDGILLPPLLLNEKYHKIAIQKGTSSNNHVIAKINYYMGYNNYWRDIGGI